MAETSKSSAASKMGYTSGQLHTTHTQPHTHIGGWREMHTYTDTRALALAAARAAALRTDRRSVSSPPIGYYIVGIFFSSVSFCFFGAMTNSSAKLGRSITQYVFDWWHGSVASACITAICIYIYICMWMHLNESYMNCVVFLCNVVYFSLAF